MDIEHHLEMLIISLREHINVYDQGPLLLPWINFNPSMDK